MRIEQIVHSFIDIYGHDEISNVEIFHSPGRVNLIGEHIDYNGGYVFPCALDFGTFAIVRKREDNIVNLASTNFNLRTSVNLENIVYLKEDDWANYPKGVMKIMMEKGYNVEGMDLLVSGNIPNGAGLSSSASLEVLVAEIINSLFNESKINKIDLALICQEAENKFVGVNCGIMDQFAVALGQKDKGILLNCKTLEYDYADVNLEDYSLVLMNTNKRRALNESKYNERRNECHEALHIINKYKKIKELCDLSIQEYEEVREKILDEVIRKRADHVIHENHRVTAAYKALKERNLIDFGKLLSESHNSLRDLYEVTGAELDTIVDISLKVKGCIGARMTGAGFGGCAIAVVKKEELESFQKEVKEAYKHKIGYEPTFYISGIGDGVRKHTI